VGKKISSSLAIEAVRSWSFTPKMAIGQNKDAAAITCKMDVCASKGSRSQWEEDTRENYLLAKGLGRYWFNALVSETGCCGRWETGTFPDFLIPTVNGFPYSRARSSLDEAFLSQATLRQLLKRSPVAESSWVAEASKTVDHWRAKRMNRLKTLEKAISKWPNVSTHQHRFGGREFRFGSAEIGHVHTDGIVDIPFQRLVRDALLAHGLAEEHRWVPNSGWTTFHVRSDEDLKHAQWLMRLSYLRYALKTAADPRRLLEQESEELGLSPQFKLLLESFVPKNTNPILTEPLPA
jgi:hypothetical protein